MSRLHQILIAILAVQIALGVYTFWPQSSTAEARQPLLADFSTDAVVEITLSDGDNNRLTLAKTGTDWVLSEAGDFPVDAEKVPPFLEKLAAVETGRRVTETESSHGQLQVAEEGFNRRVDIKRQDGGSDTLFIGSSGGPQATHVRVNNQPEVYLSGEIGAFDANVQASNWIDTLYFTIPQSTTTAIRLENENGIFDFKKEGETWTLADLAEDEIFNAEGVTTLLNQTHSIRMTEPVGLISEAGSTFAAPIATVTIETPDQTYTLQIGAQQAEDNDYLFATSAASHYVHVSQFTGDNITSKSRADFLQAPAETEEDGATIDSE